MKRTFWQKDWRVGTHRDFDQQFGFVVRVGMIALETSTNVTCLHPNYGIFSGSVVRLPAKNVHPDQPLSQQIALTADLLIDYVLQEFLATTAR